MAIDGTSRIVICHISRLISQALWFLGYMLLTLSSAIQSTSPISTLIIGLALFVCIPCMVIPLWLAWAVWTRRQYKFLIGLWTTWTLYVGIMGNLSYFINSRYGYAISLDSAFISIVAALMLMLPAYISAIYIATTPSVHENQWW